jgi:hypothetical protein
MRKARGKGIPFGRIGKPLGITIRFEKFSTKIDDYQPPVGPSLGLNPRGLLMEAAARERSGGIGSAREFRARANLFQKLKSDNRTRTLALWEFEDEDWETFEIVAWLAKSDSKAVEVLFRKAFKYCECLALLGAANNANAAASLAAIAILATYSTTEFARKNSEALRELARSQLAWPFLKSPIKVLSTGHKPLLKKLEVGKGCVTAISRNPLFIPKSRFGYISWKLWHYINETRNRMRFFRQHNSAELKQIEREIQGGLALEKQAANLPDFNKGLAVSKWVELGKQFLSEAYPHPEFPGELNEETSGLKVLIKSEKHLRSHNSILDRIYQEIDRDFEKFAKPAT